MSNPGNPEFEMFALFEMTPDLVCIAGEDGFFRKVNPAVINKLGYTQEELFGHPIKSFIHEEDKDATHKSRSELLSGKALLNFVNRYVAKDGKIVWLEWTSVYFPDKKIVFAIAKDVTERKLTEKEAEEKYRQSKSSAAHFKSSIEKDRKYLAYELHEDLAQLACVVKMDIGSICVNEPGLSVSAKSKIENALLRSDLLVNTIRRISFAMSPNMLNDLGLNAVFEGQCREFSTLNGIPCEFESDYDEAYLTHEVKLDFFRICQESLKNVMHHAGATNVKISIEDIDNKIQLAIVDDGKGFEMDYQKQTSGLTNMRERAASINGHLTIQSEPGKGTRVCVSIAK